MISMSDLLRAGTIKRWHMVNTAREQTLAEHNYNVAVIAMYIALEMGKTREEVMEVIVAALFDDAAEARTGDIPTPTKEWLNQHYPGALEKLERSVMPVVPLSNGVDRPEYVNEIVKMADAVEAAVWIGANSYGPYAGSVADRCFKKAHAATSKHGINLLKLISGVEL